MTFWDLLESFLRGLITKDRLRANTSDGALPTASIDTNFPIQATLYSHDEDEQRKRTLICEFAQAQIGEPYHWGASGDGDLTDWDCSQLTRNSHMAAGLEFLDGCVFQYGALKHRKVLRPKPGDVWFYGPSEKGTWHTGLHLGDGVVLHAKGGTGVIVQPDHEVEMNPRFLGYFRHPEFAYPEGERA